MKTFNFREAALRLNAKVSPYNTYTMEEIRSLFRECNLPSSWEFFKSLENTLLITKSSKGRYKFSKTPFQFVELEIAHRQAKEVCKGYPSIVAKAENTKKHQAMTEAEAIALLKSRGYVIYKQL